MKHIKKTLLIMAISNNVYAITDGTPVDWNTYQDMTTMGCTGTLIAGKFILTAAHCTSDETIRFSDNTVLASTRQVDHPDWDLSGAKVDVSLWTLPDIPETTQIHYFADLTQTTVKDNDTLKLFGFGSTDGNETPLHYATVNAEFDPTYQQVINGLFTNQGQGVGGDSGGAWLNNNNEIVAINKSIYGTTTFGTNLHYADEFIRQTIDGWHYPTLANTSNGSATITVQSLHQNTVTDSAYTSGDVQIIGGTCIENGEINSYDKCTYVIESQGGEGNLILGRSDEVIQINKPVPVIDNGSSSSDGGSFGLLSLLLFSGFGFYRRKKSGSTLGANIKAQ
ncbi:trypsin-like serine protease [Aliivibrio salmonicida]|uniref:trypsin-like serine protease n=1 Tax=Aliivibrio salmonicida TaxID=40269 RepID=UPI003D0B71F2